MAVTLTCGYRIYPSWFRNESTKPIAELAHGSAARMGRQVVSIDIIGNGEDWRGVFIDFDVTYSSTVEHPWMERST